MLRLWLGEVRKLMAERDERRRVDLKMREARAEQMGNRFLKARAFRLLQKAIERVQEERAIEQESEVRQDHIKRFFEDLRAKKEEESRFEEAKQAAMVAEAMNPDLEIVD